MSGGRRWTVGFLIVLLALGAVISYAGIQGAGRPVLPTNADERVEPLPTTGPVVRIDLPHEEPELPPGPNREQFRNACTVCHSTRLVLTQPRLPAKKWDEVVHKMVAVYGAPLTRDEEHAIVGYLATMQGN